MNSIASRAAFLPASMALGTFLLISGCANQPSSSPTPLQIGKNQLSAPLALKSFATPCDSLQGRKIEASSIGLPTRGAVIEAASMVSDSDGTMPPFPRSYCKLTGSIQSVDPQAQPIKFQINLPAQWNQRAVQMGGGGFNGSVVTGLAQFTNSPPDIASPLAQGFATFGSDSGHQSNIPFDGSFGMNQEQLDNFGRYQVKKTVDVAKAMMALAYGSRPIYTYFLGHSQGGHEAFDAAQRYPQDYEGIVASYPAYNLTNMHMGSWAQARAVYGDAFNKPSPAWANPAKIKRLTDAVMAACDGLDGVQDGIISNIPACNKAFSVDTVRASLRCTGGADTGDTCLSDAQIEMVRKISSPAQFNFAFAGGATSYARWPMLEGAPFTANHLGRTNSFAMEPFTAAENAFQLKPATGHIRGFTMRDAKIDTLAFNPEQHAKRIQEVGISTDTVSTDLSALAAKGSKMLFMHGTADDSITPHNSIAYWERLQARYGASIEGAVHFATVPGFGHGNGLFNARWNSLAALQAWVERGIAPQDAMIALDANTTPATASTNGRTRPICTYPKYPRYNGTGPVNAAASFTCTAP
jgi:pimeloyl-ACP methyl ester carboxylesterase